MQPLTLSLMRAKNPEHCVPFVSVLGLAAPVSGENTFSHDVNIAAYVFETEDAALHALHVLNQFRSWDATTIKSVLTPEGLCIYSFLMHGDPLELPVQVVDMRTDTSTPLVSASPLTTIKTPEPILVNSVFES